MGGGVAGARGATTSGRGAGVVGGFAGTGDVGTLAGIVSGSMRGTAGDGAAELPVSASIARRNGFLVRGGEDGGSIGGVAKAAGGVTGGSWSRLRRAGRTGCGAGDGLGIRAGLRWITATGVTGTGVAVCTGVGGAAVAFVGGSGVARVATASMRGTGSTPTGAAVDAAGAVGAVDSVGGTGAGDAGLIG